MKKRIREHLQMALNIEDFAINFAKQEGDRDDDYMVKCSDYLGEFEINLQAIKLEIVIVPFIKKSFISAGKSKDEPLQ